MSIIISLIVFFSLLALAWWVVNELGLPAPLPRISRVIIVVLGALYLLQIVGLHDFGLYMYR